MYALIAMAGDGTMLRAGYLSTTMEESGMLIYDTLFVRVWSGGGMVHTESVMASFLFWLSFPLLPVHTNQNTLKPSPILLALNCSRTVGERRGGAGTGAGAPGGGRHHHDVNTDQHTNSHTFTDTDCTA